MSRLTRRHVLRGALNGMAVIVATPILDCFLDDGGRAWASGAALPVRFGTWFWGLGITPDRWAPQKTGQNYEIGPELEAIEPWRDQVSILSGFDVLLDGKPNLPHISGGIGLRTGVAPTSADLPAPSFDVLIADQIGRQSRFSSLEISATGDPANSLSGRGNGSLNPAEVSPVALYTRLFGPGFVDPNSAAFKPDPLIMAQKSVLAAVSEQRKALEQQVGAADRQKLDQYFTALRETEQQLAIQLEPPQPIAGWQTPPKPTEQQPGNQIENVIANHKTMARLLAMALYGNQTRVFNVNFNNPASALTRLGSTISHHQLTHEEPIDARLGYQPQATWFVERCMEGFATFVQTLASLQEGAGTLLDNAVVLAHSETQFAKFHTIDGIPMMLAGRGGGRLKAGVHVAGGGSPATRVGLTLQQVMGLSVETWGSNSLETSKPIAELLA
jgi:Protein of unknown function (DUF1552)